MNKTLNMLFAVGGSRLYKTPEEARVELERVGFLHEFGEYRYYPDESEVDEDYQSGWITARIQLLGGDSRYYIEFEFMV